MYLIRKLKSLKLQSTNSSELQYIVGVIIKPTWDWVQHFFKSSPWYFPKYFSSINVFNGWFVFLKFQNWKYVKNFISNQSGFQLTWRTTTWLTFTSVKLAYIHSGV